MKKFLTFILCICFIIPGMFLLSACSSGKEIIDFKILNNDNPIDDLTTETVKDIYVGDILTWSEI